MEQAFVAMRDQYTPDEFAAGMRMIERSRDLEKIVSKPVLCRTAADYRRADQIRLENELDRQGRGIIH